VEYVAVGTGTGGKLLIDQAVAIGVLVGDCELAILVHPLEPDLCRSIPQKWQPTQSSCFLGLITRFSESK
jgi:hypothetical protein